MNKAVVGIYMPARNVAKYIGEAIHSIMAQDMNNWSLVVLDDASDDETFDVATEVCDGRCFVARNGDRCGLIGNLKNQAIDLLVEEPEFICHVGADDMIPPDCLSSYVAFMKTNPDVAAACGTFDCFNDMGNRWMMSHVQTMKGFDRNTLLKFMNFFPHRFYRYEAIKAIGGYSELSSAVDYDLVLRLDEQFKLGRLEGKITYHYRQHEKQVSFAYRNEQDANAKKALQRALERRGIKKLVVNNSPPFLLEDVIEDHFIWGKQ